MSGLAPNLGRPQEYTDPFGNVSVSTHAPTTATQDSTGAFVPQRAVDSEGYNPNTQFGFQSETNNAGQGVTRGGTVGTDTAANINPITGAANNIVGAVTGSGAGGSGQFNLMQIAEDAKQQAIASGAALEDAEAIRNQYLTDAYGQAQGTLDPFMQMGDAYSQAQGIATGGVDQQALGDYQSRVGQTSGDYLGSASVTPQSSYFQQAADTMGARPTQLEDIEGYDLMQQARDEALRASGQRFAGGGKLFSGSRGVEAANIGGQAAMDLMNRDAAMRQQDVSNLMSMGQQETALQQQELQNRMGMQQLTGQMDQQQLQNYRNLMMDKSGLDQQQFQNLMSTGGVGYDAANKMAGLQVGQGQALGGNVYGTQQDIANLKAGGMAQQGSLAGLQLQQQIAKQQADSQNTAGWLGMAGMLGGALLCDERLKENAVLVGDHNGINIYEFNYIGDSKRRVGPMAQEVLKVNPDAVFEMDGYLAVDGRLL